MKSDSPLQQLKDRALLKTAAYVDGAWLERPVQFAVHDPATGAELARVAKLDAADAEAAIAAAERAWPAWRERTAKDRANLLMRWFKLMHEHADDLARIMTAEQGKPLAEARGEVLYAASFVE